MRKVGARGTHSSKNGEVWSSHVVASQKTEKKVPRLFYKARAGPLSIPL